MTTETPRETGIVARVSGGARRAVRALAVGVAVAWLDRAAARAARRARRRTRDLAPRPGQPGHPIRFLIVNAWGVGGTIRATMTTAALLAENHDVEIVSVLRTTREPQMTVPDGLRLRALFDRTEVRRGGRDLVPRLLGRAPSRLWHPRDGNVGRVSLWTDVLLLRWLRSLPNGTVVIATRPAFIMLASRFAPAGVIVIAQEHQRLDRYGAQLRDAILEALGNVSAVVVLTETDRAAYEAPLGPDGPRVVAIPNAVPDVPLGPGDPAVHRLIAAGRFAPQKGFDLLLEAFAAVASRHPDWSLDIFGKGALRESLERSIADLGLTAQVHLNHPTDRLGEEMRRASVFVLSSRFEGFPIVLLEALSAGLAVVSFDCPTGPGEILAGEAAGILVPAEDVPALAAALDRIMTDEPMRRRLAAAAPGAVVPYSTAEIGRRWEGLLADGVDGARGRHP
ncbi:MAG: glycosyltransferase family 4 protein [Chloroflexota bacterium]